MSRKGTESKPPPGAIRYFALVAPPASGIRTTISLLIALHSPSLVNCTSTSCEDMPCGITGAGLASTTAVRCAVSVTTLASKRTRSPPGGATMPPLIKTLTKGQAPSWRRLSLVRSTRIPSSHILLYPHTLFVCAEADLGYAAIPVVSIAITNVATDGAKPVRLSGFHPMDFFGGGGGGGGGGVGGGGGGGGKSGWLFHDSSSGKAYTVVCRCTGVNWNLILKRHRSNRDGSTFGPVVKIKIKL